jgi:hypothetical protein
MIKGVKIFLVGYINYSFVKHWIVLKMKMLMVWMKLYI